MSKEKIVFEFKNDVEITTSDFWYDFVGGGGYIKPEEVLANQEQVEKVRTAMHVLRSFYDQLENKNLINCL